MSSKKFLLYIGAPALLLIVVIAGSNNQTLSNFSRSSSKQSFNKKRLSVDDPNSLWVVVNKTRPLNPANYAPPDLITPNIPLRFSADNDEMKLRRPAAEALETMVADAKKESVNLMNASAYRSYNLQTIVYNDFVKSQGKSTADTQSARPGFSEHQTGLAVDLEPTDRSCEVEDCFANTAEGKWLAKNAYKYGFILRYQPTTQSIVGYKYEPWHFRYVGQELATELKNQNNATLEDFFGLGSAPDYN